LSSLEQEGAVQRFEFTLELGWKTLRDFLEHSGVAVEPVTPKQVVKLAFAAKIIRDGQLWIDMLDHRNLLSHSYDQAVFAEAVRAMAQRYLRGFEELCERLNKEIAA
jgi:nucleotidyltransferase substrate binding protein (TIGR01987 family)